MHKIISRYKIYFRQMNCRPQTVSIKGLQELTASNFAIHFIYLYIYICVYIVYTVYTLYILYIFDETYVGVENSSCTC
jgi:hypothetical protein